MPDHSKILSIIIPTYNSSKTIIQALDSFDYTRQDDFEICLIDDGSKEDIKDLIAPMMGRYPDTIKYFKKENGNWGSVMNYAKTVINGKWVKVLDSDDLVNGADFNKYLNYLEEIDDTKHDLVFTSFLLHDIVTNKFETKYFQFAGTEMIYGTFDNMSYNGTFSHHMLTISSKLFKSVVQLPTGIYYTDNILIYDIIRLSKGTVFLPKNILIYIYNVGDAEQSINIKNIAKRRDQWIVVLKAIASLPIVFNITIKRSRLLSKFIKRMVYFLVLAGMVNDGTSRAAKKKELKEINDIIGYLHYSRKLQIYTSPYIILIRTCNITLLKMINKTAYSTINWGLVASIKAKKNKKNKIT